MANMHGFNDINRGNNNNQNPQQGGMGGNIIIRQFKLKIILYDKKYL